MSNKHKLEHSKTVLTAVHEPNTCAGRNCTIHNMSQHHMRDFPQHWRDDRKIMERICSCGVGHPDPDEVNDPSRIHGCCGLCITGSCPSDAEITVGDGIC